MPDYDYILVATRQSNRSSYSEVNGVPVVALASACRNEPGPLSFVFVTFIAAPAVGLRLRRIAATPMATVVVRLIEPFISLCRCPCGD